MNIAELLHKQALERPDAPAVIDTHHGHSRTTTYAQLEDLSARIAAVLLKAGLKPGDPVLVFQPMSMELYAVLMALFRLGLVAMFLDPGSGPAHFEQSCEIYPPKALIASSKAMLLKFQLPMLRSIPHQFSIGFPFPGAISLMDKARHYPPEPTIMPCEPDSPALITFTSGSTGQPKAAVRTHGFLLAQHKALAESLDIRPGQCEVSTLPIFALANLASGATCLIPPGDLRRPGAVNPQPILREIEANRPSRMIASPAFLECLIEGAEARAQKLDSLETVFTGGAPVFPNLLERFGRIAPQAEMVAVYGSTEAEPIAHIHYRDMPVSDLLAMKSGAGLLAGLPVESLALRIIRQQWGRPLGELTRSELEAMTLPAGVAGEIVVSGTHVLPGYLHGHGDAETKFGVEGARWHRTGDAGYLDAQGRLWLLGRCSARIDDERGTLYPFAVECALSCFPGVLRTALVSHQGKRLLVLETSDPPKKLDREALLADLAWAFIDDVLVMRRIPVDKRHNAKIDYPALLQMLDNRDESAV